MGTAPTRTAPITESTTLSNARFAFALIALLIGAVLIGRGVYGVATQSASGSAMRTVDALHEGRSVERSFREAARQQFLASSDGNLISQAGFIATVEARNSGIATADGRAWLKTGIEDLRAGLSKSPADGFAWLRLAGAEYLSNGSTPQVASALQMAYYTVRRSKKSDPLFMTLSAQIWPLLGSDVQGHVAGIIRTYWSSHRPSLTSLAGTSAGRALLTTVVGADPELPGWLDVTARREQARRKRLQEAPPPNAGGLRR
jgi:hypothetical protein